MYDFIEVKKVEGYYVIYIGKKNYLELEGVVGIVFDIVYFIERVDDLKILEILIDKILVIN